MIPSDCFRQEIGDVQDSQLLGCSYSFWADWTCVCHNNMINAIASFHLLEGVVTKEAVRCNAVDLLGISPFDSTLR